MRAPGTLPAHLALGVCLHLFLSLDPATAQFGQDPLEKPLVLVEMPSAPVTGASAGADPGGRLDYGPPPPFRPSDQTFRDRKHGLLLRVQSRYGLRALDHYWARILVTSEDGSLLERVQIRTSPALGSPNAGEPEHLLLDRTLEVPAAETSLELPVVALEAVSISAFRRRPGARSPQEVVSLWTTIPRPEPEGSDRSLRAQVHYDPSSAGTGFDRFRVQVDRTPDVTEIQFGDDWTRFQRNPRRAPRKLVTGPDYAIWSIERTEGRENLSGIRMLVLWSDGRVTRQMIEAPPQHMRVATEADLPRP